jgi:hypothetical protein
MDDAPMTANAVWLAFRTKSKSCDMARPCV